MDRSLCRGRQCSRDPYWFSTRSDIVLHRSAALADRSRVDHGDRPNHVTLGCRCFLVLSCLVRRTPICHRILRRFIERQHSSAVLQIEMLRYKSTDRHHADAQQSQYPCLVHRRDYAPDLRSGQQEHKPSASASMRARRFGLGVPKASASPVRLQNRRGVSRTRCGRWWRLLRPSRDSRGSDQRGP